MINGVHTLNVLVEVAEERHRQDETWGQQDFPFHHPVDAGGHTLVGQPYGRWADDLKNACDARRNLAKRGGPDRRSGLLVLLEEVAEAATETDPRLIREELVQVAAVAVKLIETLDRAEAKKHGPGCELGMWHGGECGPSVLLDMTRRMSVAPVPETFRPGVFSKITRETVEDTIKNLMAEPYRPDVSGLRRAWLNGELPAVLTTPWLLEGVPGATLELRLEPIPFLKPDTTDLGDDMVTLERARNVLGRAPRCLREAATAKPCPQHSPADGTYTTGVFDEGGPVPPLRRELDEGPAVASVRHPYNGGDRLHGICRCAEGRDHWYHQCPDCEHGFHLQPCRELTGTGAPGDVDECGCTP